MIPKRLLARSDDTPRRHGQILVLYALMLPALVAMVALAINLAQLYAERQGMQEAADLAALAGSSQLPGSAAGAIALAADYAASNGYERGVASTTPFSGANQAIPQEQKIQVEITKAVKLFIPFFTKDTVTLSVRAVAFRPPPGSSGPWVFFANRTDCAGTQANPTVALEFHGGNDTVTGAIHSNGSIRIQGGSYKLNLGTTGLNTYACTKTTDYGSTIDLTKTAVKPFPIAFAYSDFACTYTLSPSQPTLAAWTYPQFFNGQTMKDGVYCSTGDIKLGWVPPGPKVTFVAKGKVELTGGLNLSPYSLGVLAYTESTGGSNSPAFNTVGGGSVGSGIIYAPNGHAHILGGGFKMSISVYANTIDVLGGGSTFTKADTGGGVAPPGRLIE
jgi:hypothetical protein